MKSVLSRSSLLPKLGAAFNILWAGQTLSLLGTSMTRFALLLWAYQMEGTATSLALLGFFSCLTYVVASPFAGVVADRWNRRRVMFLADLGAGVMTLLLLLIHAHGQLQLWHLYLAQGVSGACEAFQEPAFAAAVALVVPRRAYTRANGLLGLGKAAARMFAPLSAGLLLSQVGLNGVLLADLGSLLLALSGLLWIRIPTPPPSLAGRQAAGSFWHELRFGWRYVWGHAGLRGLLGTFFLVNLFGTLTYLAILSPMILRRSGGNEAVLSMVRLAMGLGGIAGGVLLSVWGGTRRKTRTYLVSTLLSFLICDFLTAISRSSAGWMVAGFLSELTLPFILSPYFALWQELVPPDVQGRVFATREMVQVTAQPVGYLCGGLLADYCFEPALQSGSWLSTALGLLVGHEPGSGMAAMFLCTSLLGALTGLLGLLSPSIRALDQEEQL